MNWRACLLAITLVLAVFLTAADASAHGAFAIGLPANVSKEGVAIGSSWGYDTSGEAETRALKECLTFMDAPPSTRALCKVERTFQNECVAVAIDPKAGTPGVGWAIKAVKDEADAAALAECKKTAGKSRTRYCVITTSECDGK